MPVQRDVAQAARADIHDDGVDTGAVGDADAEGKPMIFGRHVAVVVVAGSRLRAVGACSPTDLCGFGGCHQRSNLD